ncbi:MAG: 23S rRNA (uracil(1939)-C(5))-methyltransferase RlmD, partial [Lachnospiraceae bacterium]|nr:23S rRNA (uracil(1939)-C(5))-methyltransferase RlmD [Lachnospiraceae bacterium]
MKKGQEYTGVVEKVRFPGKGVVRAEGDIPDKNSEREEADAVNAEYCIVKGVVKGQRIRFRVTKKRSGRAEGMLLEVIERSPDEVDAMCPHFGTCGGCSYLNLPYEKQLKLKEEQVKDILYPVFSSKEDLDNVWEGIRPSPIQYEYRNKMEFSFGDASIGGELELGLHKVGSCYDIISVKKCCIIDSDYRDILTETLAYFRGKETPYYHKKDHKGYLRHLIIRKAKKTGEILVDLVTTSQSLKDTPCTFVSLLEDYKELLLSLKLEGQIAGILNTINDSVADTVINERTDILYGSDHFFEELSGLRFKITPFSFFQTNTLSAEVLYETAREYIMSTIVCNAVSETEGDVQDERERENKPVIFDLYSGTGTITQIMAPIAKKVVGVEIVEEAVRAAISNSELNGLHNVEYICGDVLKVIDDLKERPDIIILDPPRDGIHPKAIKKIIDFGVDHILYISCKPTSLQRDLEIFLAQGYMPSRICAIDQFP